MIYERDLEAFEAHIARDKNLLSAYQRNEAASGYDKEETAQEIEELKGSIASLEQMMAWLRYKSSAD
jgi:hypothetical protein